MAHNEDGSDIVRQRRKHRSNSPDEDRSTPRRKKPKHKKDRSLTPEGDSAQEKGNKGPAAETEEEYDARLEKEENERRETERKKELEGIRKQYMDDAQSTDGVRFKGLFYISVLYIVLIVVAAGRGRMKYVDPEVHQRRH
jgi:peptidyl-prolyl isomerase G (cyclophilin G)